MSVVGERLQVFPVRQGDGLLQSLSRFRIHFFAFKRCPEKLIRGEVHGIDRNRVLKLCDCLVKSSQTDEKIAYLRSRVRCEWIKFFSPLAFAKSIVPASDGHEVLGVGESQRA